MGMFIGYRNEYGDGYDDDRSMFCSGEDEYEDDYGDDYENDYDDRSMFLHYDDDNTENPIEI